MGENLKIYIDENKDKKMKFIEFEDNEPSIIGIYVYLCIYPYVFNYVVRDTCIYVKMKFIEFEDNKPSIIGICVFLYICIYT
jgi:hypothetical protein